MSREHRMRYLNAIRRDLLGPWSGPDEILELPERSLPRDQYMTGLLNPQTSLEVEDPVEQEAQEELDEHAEDDPAGLGDSIAMGSRRGAVSMGISFALEVDSSDDTRAPVIELVATGAFYRPEEEDAGKNWSWKRHPVEVRDKLRLEPSRNTWEMETEHGLVWFVRCVTRNEGRAWQVTVVLSNMAQPSLGRVEVEKHTLFQSKIHVRPLANASLVPRPVRSWHEVDHDQDSAVNALLYRNQQEWAVGHTSSATWVEEDDQVVAVESAWLPEQVVPAMSPDGDPVFNEVAQERGFGSNAFNASVLGRTRDAAALCDLLAVLPDAYERWLLQQERLARYEFSAPGRRNEDYLRVFERNLTQTRGIIERMRAGVELLRCDATAREAFCLAQQAMVQQLLWKPRNTRSTLIWRPFQLGFQLLTLAGLVQGESTDRDVMDLLWFPTGGGKTEAYLALTAVSIFHRRLRHADQPDKGAGTTVLMRYTLRLLTIQQFERATRLILACENTRRRHPTQLGNAPISIGLWVGGDATPNRIKDARDGSLRSAEQLVRCPVCGQDSLVWDLDRTSEDFLVGCEETSCEMGLQHGHLPIYTVDEMVYRYRPSLVIGTVDKFAQVVRNAATGNLFGGDELEPPDLIIQDELHLISGPLGTVTGLYEAAIDMICSHGGRRPKILGSTATIRRAAHQVRALFDREVCQFPPPVLDADNSCFARVDQTRPGRLYVGVTTTGNSPKFTLQATSAVLLQNASPGEGILTTDKELDPYWTLLLYFNALRELGGALVMVHDDVSASIKRLAAMHGTPARDRLEHLELSSRLGSVDIPAAISELEQPVPEQAWSVVLATNMISVGVDISRLGLMVVNGQPKSMSEYIQATSRVGRQDVAGLIFTLYNAGRPRDLSHYESFRSWHQALYSSVEATSVTPFAPRARDRALHACIVAIARHLVPRLEPSLSELRSQPVLTSDALVLIESVVSHLAERAGRVDRRTPGLEDDIMESAHSFLRLWRQMQPEFYWNDFRPETSLLMSYEQAAAQQSHRLMAQPTPNSMREVEPPTVFRMLDSLANQGGHHG